MINIQKQIHHYNSEVSKFEAQLIAISKTKPDKDIIIAYESGQRHFGENKVQELSGKFERLPKDIKWHMVGHLQRNKIKFIANFVYLIHSVDSERLLAAIDKQARKVGRTINVLLQIHIAEEDTKSGFTVNEIDELINSPSFKSYSNVKISGLMGMATNTENKSVIRSEFKGLKDSFEKLKSEHKVLSNMDTISMGMSGDYKIALEEGSTMIRIGSSIFGSRNYAS